MVYERDERDTEEGAPADSASMAFEGSVPADDDSDAPIQMDEQDLEPGFLPGGDVRAENVTISQGGASNVDATTVSITQGGAARVLAGDFSISQGGVGLAQTEQLTVNEGGSVFAVFADEANVADGGSVFMLLARSTSGDVRPVLDWRAALAFGAAFALALRILRRR